MALYLGGTETGLTVWRWVPSDPHLILFERMPGVGKPVTVPIAAFKFAHDGPSVERPPARLGEHTNEVLKAASVYFASEIGPTRRRS